MHAAIISTRRNAPPPAAIAIVSVEACCSLEKKLSSGEECGGDEVGLAVGAILLIELTLLDDALSKSTAPELSANL